MPLLQAESEDDENLDEECRARMLFVMLCCIFLMHFPATITAMESQIENMPLPMRSSISALKTQKEKKPKKKKRDESAAAMASKAAKERANYLLWEACSSPYMV